MTNEKVNKQERLDELYLDIATRISEMSHATRAKVGSVVVRGNNIISFGWNGMPSGFPNEDVEYVDDAGVLRTNQDVLHAELNALTKISNQGGLGASGATLYVTLSPCRECVKLIIQAGIKRVVFRNEYRDVSGLKVLERANILCEYRPKEQK